MMGKDIFLRHNFTDRSGAEVYDAFDADDRLQMDAKLFELRIKLSDSDDKVGIKRHEPRHTILGGGTG